MKMNLKLSTKERMLFKMGYECARLSEHPHTGIYDDVVETLLDQLHASLDDTSNKEEKLFEKARHDLFLQLNDLPKLKVFLTASLKYEVLSRSEISAILKLTTDHHG